MQPPQGLQLRQWHLERKRRSCQGAAAAEGRAAGRLSAVRNHLLREQRMALIRKKLGCKELHFTQATFRRRTAKSRSPFCGRLAIEILSLRRNQRISSLPVK